MKFTLSNLPGEYESIVDQAVKEMTKKTLSLDTLQDYFQLKFEQLTLKKRRNRGHALSAKQVKVNALAVENKDIRRLIVGNLKPINQNNQKIGPFITTRIQK